MKIAHIANMYGPNSGGLRTTVDQLAIQYVSLGNDVLVVTPSDSDTELISGRTKKVEVAAPKLPFSGGYRVIVRLGRVRKIIDEFSPQVMEISDRTTLVLLAPWARRRGIRVTLFAHERLNMVMANFLRWFPLREFALQLWNRWTSANVDQIVATTKFASYEFEKSDALRIVPLGVDHQQFNRKSMSLDQDTNGIFEGIESPYWFSCSRLSREKDPTLLLEISKEMKNRGIDLPIVVAGTGPMHSSLARVVRNQGLNVRFVGFIKNKNLLALLMARATVFLAPGPLETFGLAALESLAVGTPVIARSSSAVGEVISDETGVVLSREPKKWVDAALRFQSMDRDLLALNCFKRANSFDWRKTAEMLMKMHHEDSRLSSFANG